MKKITLTLYKDLIIEAVKSETYDTGRMDKSADPVKNAPGVLSKQAGGEKHQERLLLRYLKTSVAKFQAQLAEFLDGTQGSVTDTLNATDNQFKIIFVVNDRINDGLVKPLSSLCEDYLVNSILFSWYQKDNQEFAKSYLIMADNSLQHVRLTLSKTAPTSSEHSYNDVTGTVVPIEPGTDISEANDPNPEPTPTENNDHEQEPTPTGDDTTGGDTTGGDTTGGDTTGGDTTGGDTTGGESTGDSSLHIGDEGTHDGGHSVVDDGQQQQYNGDITQEEPNHELNP